MKEVSRTKNVVSFLSIVELVGGVSISYHELNTICGGAREPRGVKFMVKRLESRGFISVTRTPSASNSYNITKKASDWLHKGKL